MGTLRHYNPAFIVPTALGRHYVESDRKENMVATSGQWDSEIQHCSTQKPIVDARTDPTRWRLRDNDSRHTWHYLADDEAMREWPQTCEEKYFLNLPLVRGTGFCLLRAEETRILTNRSDLGSS